MLTGGFWVKRTTRRFSFCLGLLFLVSEGLDARKMSVGSRRRPMCLLFFVFFDGVSSTLSTSFGEVSGPVNRPVSPGVILVQRVCLFLPSTRPPRTRDSSVEIGLLMRLPGKEYLGCENTSGVSLGVSGATGLRTTTSTGPIVEQ